MTYPTTATSSPSGSPSPSTSPSSTSSPETPPTCLDPSIMTSHAESSQSARSTPSHSSIDLPRTQTASKGGCWTCRLRRKKCDEQREGNTCQTCKRLTITCLGWGARRPEWMRDKKAVDEYKAGIKERLNRAGLIRGQPRSNLLNRNVPSRNSAAVASRPSIQRRPTAPEVAPSTASSLGLLPNNSHEDISYYPRPIFPNEPYGFPDIPGAPNSSVFGEVYSYNAPMGDMGMMHPGGIYPVEPHISSLSNPNFDFTGFSENFTDQATPLFQVPSQQSINIRQILHDFEPVRQLLFRFDAYGTVAEVTLSLIEKDPSGPVTKAVQALGQLHKQRMRVSQGIELDAKPNQSPADYFHQEALTQLKNNKELQQHLKESDAVAALYLVFFSQLSGCTTDWDEPFAILSDWLIQRRLPATEEPWIVFQDMSAGERLVVKGALWVDIIASVTTGRGPKFFSLWRRLLGERGTYWVQNHTMFQRGLRMDTLVGCPDEALLMILEVSLLAQWKTTTQHEGILSYRELIRQGNDIEQRMKHSITDTRLISDNNVTLIQNEMMSKPEMLLDDETRGAVATLFREAAVLYLNTVLSGPCPGVPDISEGVRKITQIIRSLHRSPEVERGAVLPIILAGCMTNDSIHREFLKGRFLQNEGIGNLMQLRLLMEILWQKRDVNNVHGSVSLAQVVQEQGLRLLLV